MDYRSYVLEYRTDTAEIGTAVLNDSDSTPVVVITMFRPSYLKRSTKVQLENLYNFVHMTEDVEKTRIILNLVEGRLLDQFLSSTKSDKDLRVQIALEMLKKMLRYDEFPNSIKLSLIQDDQVVLNEEGVALRELVNFTNSDLVDDKDIVTSLGNTLYKIIPELEYTEATLIDQMRNGNNDFFSIASVYEAFRDVFIYKKPAQLEKRIYIYREGEEVINPETVDEYIRNEEQKRLDREVQREEMRRDYKINAFEQKIEKQTELAVEMETGGFEASEVSLSEDGSAEDQEPITSALNDFEILRATQPRTIDLNQIGDEITSSFRQLVSEYDHERKVPVESSILPDGADLADKQGAARADAEAEGPEDSEPDMAARSTDVLHTEESDAEGARHGEEHLDGSRDGDAREEKSYEELGDTDEIMKNVQIARPDTEVLDFAASGSQGSEEIDVEEIDISNEEDFEEADSGFITDFDDEEEEKPAKKLGRKAKKRLKKSAQESFEELDIEEEEEEYINDGFTKTMGLEDEDPFFKEYKHEQTTKLDDEKAKDISEFYSKMNTIGRDGRSKSSVKIAIGVIIAIVMIVIFAVSFHFFKIWREPVVPNFSISQSSLTSVQCVNESSGINKIKEYNWEVYLNDQLLAESQGTAPTFTFSTPNTYEIHLTVVDKDGKVYGPIIKNFELKFEISNPPDNSGDK